MELLPSRARLPVAALIIVLTALFIYRDVLFLADPLVKYPWSSDSWGHLIKAEYLLEQIEQGVWYPDIFPQWYNGQQMLRYYAPLPYYGLVGLLPVAEDIFIAGNWFIFLAATVGGLSMLLYTRRFGLVFATVGGILLVILPDNMRVAFAEGNIPRVLAASLLPAAFFFLLNLLTEERLRGLWFTGLSALLCLIVLSHAMMGAIFSACLMLTVTVYWLTARGKPQYIGQSYLGIITGVLLAGWWLLPSLTGGITELNVEAATEAQVSIPWYVSLNPIVRWTNKETFYIGLSLVSVLALMPFYWKRMDGVMRTLFIVGFITIAISSTLLNPVYGSLPLHELFWPLRFMSFSGFLLVLFAVAMLSLVWRLSGPGPQSFGRYLAVGLVLVMLVDFWQSTSLVRTREAPPEVLHVAQMLRESPGWRVATADLSLLGSSPSYLFSTVGGKEQVFGWAYQGAITAPLLAMVNQAIEGGYPEYAVDRLERLGSDDLVVMKTPPQALYQVSPKFRDALPDAGYKLTFDGERISVYQKDEGPRVYKVDTSIFAIGSGAQNLALIFPEVLVGSDKTLDNYDIEFLSQFDTLVLAGFNWNSKDVAEDMVRQLANGGQHIVIDLTGTPPDTLARIPYFLEVYGERILMYDPPRLSANDEIGRYGRTPWIKPFDSDVYPWQAYVPQGLDEKDITFDFLTATAVAVGSKRVGSENVTFLGMNLMFHSVLTGDPVAIAILEQQLGVQANRRAEMPSIPMQHYVASEDGYRFSVDAPELGFYLIPIARHSGTVVLVDGEESPSQAVDTLLLVELSEGSHIIELVSQRTSVYSIGIVATSLGLLIVIAVLLKNIGVSELFRKKRFISIPIGSRVPLIRR